MLAVVGTWPGLCVSIVDYAATEFSASVGKKKGPDAAISKVLRRFVQLADDDRRTGALLVAIINVFLSFSLLSLPTKGSQLFYWGASTRFPQLC